MSDFSITKNVGVLVRSRTIVSPVIFCFLVNFSGCSKPRGQDVDTTARINDTKETTETVDTGDVGLDVFPDILRFLDLDATVGSTDFAEDTGPMDIADNHDINTDLISIFDLVENQENDLLADLCEITTQEVSEVEVICNANCFNRLCGDDGCGGSCGECDAGISCANGNCQAEIVPGVTHLWSKVFDGAYTQGIGRVVVDESGNIFVPGSYTGDDYYWNEEYSIDLGNGPMEVFGESDFFLAKFTPAGDLIWARSYGSAQEEGMGSITVTNNGEIFGIGHWSEWYGVSLDLGDGPMGSGKTLSEGWFLAKFDNEGNPLWSFGDETGDLYFPHSLPDNSLFAIGSYSDSPPQKFAGWLPVSEKQKKFFARILADGSVAWVKIFDTESYVMTRRVYVDEETGDITFVGSYGPESLTFEGQTLEPVDADCFFVGRLSVDGTLLQFKQLFEFSNDNYYIEISSELVFAFVHDIATYESGCCNEYLPWDEYCRRIQFKMSKENGIGAGSSLFGEYDSLNGWESKGSNFKKIVIGSGTETYLGGYYHSTCNDKWDLDLQPAGELDALLVKMNNGAEVAWATTFGGPGKERISNIVLTDSGRIIVTGVTKGPYIDLGGGQLTNKATTAAFIAVYEE